MKKLKLLISISIGDYIWLSLAGMSQFTNGLGFKISPLDECNSTLRRRKPAESPERRKYDDLSLSTHTHRNHFETLTFLTSKIDHKRNLHDKNLEFSFKMS